MGLLCTDAYTSGTTGARTQTATTAQMAAWSPVSGTRRRIRAPMTGAMLAELTIVPAPGQGFGGASYAEGLLEASGKRSLVAGHLLGERSHIGVLRAADRRVEGLERVLAAVARRERVAARLEAGVAHDLLARVAKDEVQEELRRVGAGCAC